MSRFYTLLLSLYYAFSLSICLSACPSACVLKFMHAFLISYRMDNIENDIYCTKGSFTDTHKISRYILAYWDMFLKLIVTYLFSIKYNEINMLRSDVQKHVLYPGLKKIFFIHYGLYIKTAG